MKKLILFAILTISTTSVYSQDFKIDSLVRIVTITDITPEPGFTLDDFESFYQNKVIPAYEESLPELEFRLVKAVRGEKEGQPGVLWFAESSDVYFKYHHPDGSYTEAGVEARKIVQPILDQLDEIATFTQNYTDWVIQYE